MSDDIEETLVTLPTGAGVAGVAGTSSASGAEVIGGQRSKVHRFLGIFARFRSRYPSQVEFKPRIDTIRDVHFRGLVNAIGASRTPIRRVGNERIQLIASRRFATEARGG